MQLRRTLGQDAALSEIGTLLLSIFIVAICALTYELLIGTLSSYLLGDSVYHFSITIGIFMSSMGLGSFLSRWFIRNLLLWFVVVELTIGIFGGFSALILYFAYASFDKSYFVVMVSVIIIIGTLIGLELPLLTRIAKNYGALRDVLAQVLGLDYVGALVASIAFPIALLPYVGLMKTAFLVGLLNLLVVFVNLRVFRHTLPSLRALVLASVAGLLLLGSGLAYAERITSFVEQLLYRDQILYSDQTRYQKVVITQWRDDLRLFLDGAIQFSSRDEYRYHESLVHPALSIIPSRERVLILGGGDGLAAREVLKYPDVQAVTLVDIDPEITRLASTYPALVSLNQGSLTNPKLKVINEDAYSFLGRTMDLYEAIIVDMPDPRNENLSKLFSVQFYQLVARHLAMGGTAAVQSTSPYFAREAFWSINHSIAAAGFYVRPYHTFIPTFGDWGFNLASNVPLEGRGFAVKVPTRFVDPPTIEGMFQFEPDVAEVPAQPSTLEDQAVLRYYLDAFHNWRSR